MITVINLWNLKIFQKFINKIFFQNVNNKNIINDKNKINTSVINDTFDKTFKLSLNKSLNNEDSVTKNIKDDNYNNNIIATNDNLQDNVVDDNLSINNSNCSNLYENDFIPSILILLTMIQVLILITLIIILFPLFLTKM